ncbi:MAG TPA: alpha-L-arabinofuranosidase C-terminal domain-containing protein [Chthonomonadaceae bacterium]|nr:alpha-L-arabinofuranosidase C-terminal domain-containing protein [Chthonomonadaceae bacterium]
MTTRQVFFRAFLLLTAVFPGVAAAPPAATPTFSVGEASADAGPQAGPSPTLFRYVRDDGAPNHLTRVQINAAHTASSPISPMVFGNFLEHLGANIYGGVWAQILLNPNLEAAGENGKTLPAWEVTGAAAWQEGGYLSPRCVRLMPKGAAGSPSGGALAQTTYLPIQRTGKYTGYLYLRAPEAPGRIAVRLLRAQGPAGPPLAQAALAAERTTWRRLAFPLVIAPGTLEKGEAVRFQVAHLDGGPVDVDQIELNPDDNLLNYDPEIVRLGRALQVPVLRWPGGNFASGYHWQDALGMRERRPTDPNAAWGGVEPNSFGINEYIHFCRLLHSQYQITVNAGDGTPEETAGWVQYCNSPPRSPFGQKRAANGSPEPYDVKLWEVGNELYGGWQIGHTDAAGNADRFLRFRDAMRQADPDITLIATGKGDEFTPEGLQRDLEWNGVLLRAAQARGPAPDYLSLHPLVPMPADLAGAPYADRYASVMAFPAFLDARMLPALAEQIVSIEGPQAKTRLAVTEWGIIYGGAKYDESPNPENLCGAVFNALILNALLRHSDRVGLANVTGLMHGGGIKKRRGIVYVDPQYWTQQIYTTAHPHTPVETLTDGPGSDVPARGFLPAVSNVPDVDVFAALTAEGQRLVVFAVNRHRTEARPLHLDVDGFDATSLSATLLTAPVPQASNTVENPDSVAPHPFSTPAWPPAPGAAWQITLPPHCLVVLTFTHR